MTNKVDFGRTSSQIKDEINESVENLHRQLALSRGHTEKGTNTALNIMLVLFVLLGQIVFGLFFEGTAKHSAPTQDSAKSATSLLADRDQRTIGSILARVEQSAEAIASVKSRVAPNMPIDAQVVAIQSSVADLRNVLGIANPSKAADGAPVGPSTSTVGK